MYRERYASFERSYSPLTELNTPYGIPSVGRVLGWLAFGMEDSAIALGPGKGEWAPLALGFSDKVALLMFFLLLWLLND